MNTAAFIANSAATIYIAFIAIDETIVARNTHATLFVAHTA
jgi:hypothetical protein